MLRKRDGRPHGAHRVLVVVAVCAVFAAIDIGVGITTGHSFVSTLVLAALTVAAILVLARVEGAKGLVNSGLLMIACGGLIGAMQVVLWDNSSRHATKLALSVPIWFAILAFVKSLRAEG